MSDPVTMDLVKMDAAIPAPDMLIVGPKGVVHTDIVRIRVEQEGTLARGTLLMSVEKEGAKVFVPCTSAGLSTAGATFAILADSTTLKTTEHADAAAYFEGDFNAAEVILPWVTEGTQRPAQLELAREPLRRHKIFLRDTHE
mgnify:FL=1